MSWGLQLQWVGGHRQRGGIDGKGKNDGGWTVSIKMHEISTMADVPVHLAHLPVLKLESRTLWSQKGSGTGVRKTGAVETRWPVESGDKMACREWRQDGLDGDLQLSNCEHVLNFNGTYYLPIWSCHAEGSGGWLELACVTSWQWSWLCPSQLKRAAQVKQHSSANIQAGYGYGFSRVVARAAATLLWRQDSLDKDLQLSNFEHALNFRETYQCSGVSCSWIRVSRQLELACTCSWQLSQLCLSQLKWAAQVTMVWLGFHSSQLWLQL